MAKAKIDIEHIATGRSVSLTKFGLSEYSDTLDASWNSVEVYGRMDPIMTYQGTKREISVGLEWRFKSPSMASTFHAQITKLMTFQYPTYADVNNALAIQSPPLVRVSFANFIGKDSTTGLLCVMKGLAYTPGIGFTPEDSPYVRFGATKSRASINPVKLSLKLGFTVLHEESLGWHFNPSNTVEGQEYGFMVPAGDMFGPGIIPDKNWAWDKQTVESPETGTTEEPPVDEKESE
tara:strand:- start:192 stop:896 length:705 start_codon:yes stop_codon:yes gene_type:complete